MSHLINTIEAQGQNRASEITLALANIGAFSSVNGKLAGVDASGNLTQVDQPQSFPWISVYNYYATVKSWGGSNTYPIQVGYRTEWRRSNMSETIDSSYAAVSLSGYPGYSIWGNQITLQAGTYLLSASFPFFASSSDIAEIRLKNETDSTFHGNKLFVGGGVQSNICYAYVTISSAKLFSWQIIAITGTLTFLTPATLPNTIINIWRF